VAELRQIVGQVLREVERQDERHPEGFGSDRNGIRAGLAAIEDETRETLEAWHREKKIRAARRSGHQWTQTREELVQVVAVALRALSAMPAPCNCLPELGPGHEDGCPADDGSWGLRLIASEVEIALVRRPGLFARLRQAVSGGGER
jgi:hypothetical protein